MKVLSLSPFCFLLFPETLFPWFFFMILFVFYMIRSRFLCHDQVIAAAKAGGGKTGGIYLQQGDVVGIVVADELGGVFVTGVGGDGDGGGVLHHMVVGDHIAVVGEDEAGAGGRSGRAG